MTIIIGYFILAYIDYDACRERLLGHHYLQITTEKTIFVYQPKQQMLVFDVAEQQVPVALLHNDSAFRLKALLYNVWSIRAFN
jgi:hypothetical protein